MVEMRIVVFFAEMVEILQRPVSATSLQARRTSSSVRRLGFSIGFPIHFPSENVVSDLMCLAMAFHTIAQRGRTRKLARHHTSFQVRTEAATGPFSNSG